MYSSFDFSLQAFENTLKSWEDKLKYDKPPLRPHLYPQQSVDLATEEEAALVQMCARAAEELITRWTCAPMNIRSTGFTDMYVESRKSPFSLMLFYHEWCPLTCALSNDRICEAAKTNGLLEQELAHAVNASSHAINKTHPKFPEVCYQHASHNIWRFFSQVAVISSILRVEDKFKPNRLPKPVNGVSK